MGRVASARARCAAARAHRRRVWRGRGARLPAGHRRHLRAAQRAAGAPTLIRHPALIRHRRHLRAAQRAAGAPTPRPAL
eukprot:6049756-Prymnesium_polylepis.1